MSIFRSHYIKRINVIILIVLVLLVVYVELVSYYFNTYNWHPIQCKHRDKCTRILLVADPQIIGNNEELIHFLTPVTIFDSDRYLVQTYWQAYNFVKPDVVIFLGDLMDEAHKATDQEFHQYVRRLFNIFLDRSVASSVRHIWLPGDNDIGGEDTLVTKDKIKRFEHAFSQPSIIRVGNLNFFKINRLISEIPVYKKNRDFFDTNEIFIGLSHISLMFKPSLFVNKVLTKMMPQILFTAHEHKAMIINTNAILREDFQLTPITHNKVYEYSLGTNDMFEILIPPASYRMGTTKIGYGFAVIENSDLKFTVLWSPSRFFYLSLYGFIICCLMFYYIFILMNRCCNSLKYSIRFRRNKNIR